VGGTGRRLRTCCAKVWEEVVAVLMNLTIEKQSDVSMDSYDVYEA
jgi:hypothetical protein